MVYCYGDGVDLGLLHGSLIDRHEMGDELHKYAVLFLAFPRRLRSHIGRRPYSLRNSCTHSNEKIRYLHFDKIKERTFYNEQKIY